MRSLAHVWWDSNGDIPEFSTSKEAEALREHLDEAQSEVAELRE